MKAVGYSEGREGSESRRAASWMRRRRSTFKRSRRPVDMATRSSSVDLKQLYVMLCEDDDRLPCNGRKRGALGL
jgi:hypothetical protein